MSLRPVDKKREREKSKLSLNSDDSAFIRYHGKWRQKTENGKLETGIAS